MSAQQQKHAARSSALSSNSLLLPIAMSHDQPASQYPHQSPYNPSDEEYTISIEPEWPQEPSGLYMGSGNNSSNHSPSPVNQPHQPLWPISTGHGHQSPLFDMPPRTPPSPYHDGLPAMGTSPFLTPNLSLQTSYRDTAEPSSPMLTPGGSSQSNSPWSAYTDLSPISHPLNLPPSPGHGSSSPALHGRSNSLTGSQAGGRVGRVRSRPRSGSVNTLSTSMAQQFQISPQGFANFHLPFFHYVPDTAERPLVPQNSYVPRSQTDRQRYVEDVQFNEPVEFHRMNPNEPGIPLVDALSDNIDRLVDPDKEMKLNGGSSISIRLNWPGYPHFTRQIAAKNFKNTPGPVTRSKLAKNVAKTIDRFINENAHKSPDGPPEVRTWRVGGPTGIKTEDLVLIGLTQVSKASWQVILQLNRPLHQQLPSPNLPQPQQLPGLYH